MDESKRKSQKHSQTNMGMRFCYGKRKICKKLSPHSNVKKYFIYTPNVFGMGISPHAHSKSYEFPAIKLNAFSLMRKYFE